MTLFDRDTMCIFLDTMYTFWGTIAICGSEHTNYGLLSKIHEPYKVKPFLIRLNYPKTSLFITLIFVRIPCIYLIRIQGVLK